jgi:hypothetical protein
MRWTVVLAGEFERVAALDPDIQDELLSRLKLLEQFGPNMGRPNVDTLDDSSFPNMKELRFRLNGLWRFAFAFDTKRQAVVLWVGTKKEKTKVGFTAS